MSAKLKTLSTKGREEGGCNTEDSKTLSTEKGKEGDCKTEDTKYKERTERWLQY